MVIQWTTDDLAKLEEAFPETRMELIEGVLYNKMGQSPTHAYVLQRLMTLLIEQYGAAFVRSQMPITLVTADSQTSKPEPDLAVTRLSYETYAGEHPKSTDLHLLIEIADSSKDIDRWQARCHGSKASLYARNGIVLYWVANIADRTLNIYTGPSFNGYLRIEKHAGEAEVPYLNVTVESLFPAQEK